MTEATLPPFTDDRLREDLERANKLSADRRLLEAWSELSLNPDLREKAREDPAGFLREWDVDVPDGIDITFIDKLDFERPTPDFEFFTIRLFNCRSYWVKKIDGVGYEQVELCFGFEFVPHNIPGGPIA